MDMSAFNHFYRLEFPEITHISGYSSLNDYNIATHFFKPDNPIGTVLAVHGYYDHVGIERNLISHLLKQKYTVVAFDLPGHGLSSGDKADIDDFSDYSSILLELYELVIYEFNPPFHIIGHSTGSAIILDGLLANEFGRISKVILASPLIHSNHWNLSKAGNLFSDIFVDEVPRIFRKNSSNDEYLDFIKYRDPLQYRKVPLNWFKSLSRWNQKISMSSGSDKDVLVIQGDSDITVDWKYNLEFITDKFQNSRIIMIEGGNHQLYNEREEIRDRVFETMIEYLEL